jgi:hypothetical protein
MPGSAVTRPGVVCSTIAAICASRPAASLARAVIRWPSLARVLVEHRGLTVGARGDREGGAGQGALLAGQVAQPLAQVCGRGDDDRGQQGPGGLARVDGVVPVAHQQPQCLAVTVGAHLRRVRAGEQLTGGTNGVDRVALALAALADVLAGIDFLDVLARTSQVPGQAQPVMPGTFDRPAQAAARRGAAGPGQHSGIAAGICRDLQLA